MTARAIVVTGIPGSGKTTLGTALGRHLRIPFLARDDVRGGQFFSAGSWTDAPGRVPTQQESVDAFLDIAEAMLRLETSCVLEYVLRRAAPQELARLCALADVRIVHLHCDAPIDRFAARNLDDPLLTRAPVLAALGFDDIAAQTASAVERMRTVEGEMLTDFGDVPVLHVDTNDGYDPSLDAIARWVA